MSPPSRRSRNNVIVVAMLAIFLWSIPFSVETIPLRPPLRSEKDHLSHAQASAHPIRKGRGAVNAASYDFTPIRREIRRRRLELAGCLMRNPEYSSQRLQLMMRWEPQGKLQSVRVVPDPGVNVSDCVAEIARQLPAKPHPALQPFAYSIALLPTGT